MPSAMSTLPFGHSVDVAFCVAVAIAPVALKMPAYTVIETDAVVLPPLLVAAAVDGVPLMTPEQN